MPFTYSAEYRALVLEQTRAGSKAADLAEYLEVSEATIHRWIAQDKIDRGERPGNTTADNAELRAARRRIVELDTELAATKRASELFAKDRVVRPKDLYPIVAQLAIEGHSSKGGLPAAANRSLGILHVADQTADPRPNQACLAH